MHGLRCRGLHPYKYCAPCVNQVWLGLLFIVRAYNKLAHTKVRFSDCGLSGTPLKPALGVGILYPVNNDLMGCWEVLSTHDFL